MLRLFEFQCPHCTYYTEALTEDPKDNPPECPNGHGKMQKLISAPSFQFANGAGTDMGRSMAVRGFPLPPTS